MPPAGNCSPAGGWVSGWVVGRWEDGEKISEWWLVEWVNGWVACGGMSGLLKSGWVGKKVEGMRVDFEGTRKVATVA